MTCLILITVYAPPAHRAYDGASSRARSVREFVREFTDRSSMRGKPHGDIETDVGASIAAAHSGSSYVTSRQDSVHLRRIARHRLGHRTEGGSRWRERRHRCKKRSAQS